jgi:hypothetical protein
MSRVRTHKTPVNIDLSRCHGCTGGRGGAGECLCEPGTVIPFPIREILQSAASAQPSHFHSVGPVSFCSIPPFRILAHRNSVGFCGVRFRSVPNPCSSVIDRAIYPKASLRRIACPVTIPPIQNEFVKIRAIRVKAFVFYPCPSVVKLFPCFPLHICESGRD